MKRPANQTGLFDGPLFDTAPVTPGPEEIPCEPTPTNAETVTPTSNAPATTTTAESGTAATTVASARRTSRKTAKLPATAAPTATQDDQADEQPAGLTRGTWTPSRTDVSDRVGKIARLSSIRKK